MYLKYSGNESSSNEEGNEQKPEAVVCHLKTSQIVKLMKKTRDTETDLFKIINLIKCTIANNKFTFFCDYVVKSGVSLNQLYVACKCKC